MSLRRFLSVALGLVGCMALMFDESELSAQNLLVQWTFDEPTGGTVNAIDTGAAPATNGVFGATATRTTDTPGGGPGFSVDLSAAGTSSIIDGGNPLEVDTLAQFTFSTWVKVTGATHYNEGGSVNVRLLAKQSSTPLFDGFSWNMVAPLTPPGSNNNFRTGLFVGGTTNFGAGFATTDIVGRGGEWIFMAVAYDGTSTENNARFYIGDENTPVVQLGDPLTINAGQVFSSNTSNGGSANARFGVGFTDAAPAVDTSLMGFQDDVRVYNGVLDLAALDAVRLDNLPPDVGLDGDYNEDGTVDSADYVVWRRDDGLQPGYDLWRANFGAGGGSGSAGASPSQSAVPEPAAALLLIAAAMLSGTLCRSARKPQ